MRHSHFIGAFMQLQPEIPRLNSDRRPMKSKFSYIVIINVTDADKRLFLTLKMTTAGLTRVCSDYSVNNPIIRNVYWEIVTILTSCANYVFICAVVRFDRNLKKKSNVIKFVTVGVIEKIKNNSYLACIC